MQSKKTIPNLEEILIKESLIDIQSVDASIEVNLVFASENNFAGFNFYGDLSKCYLQNEIAVKLKKAHALLKQRHPDYRFLVIDGTRPKRVSIMLWQQLKDTQQTKYVANPNPGSVHNYGGAVDLTILDKQGIELDMGCPIHYLCPLAEPKLEESFLKQGILTEQHLANRHLLRTVMTQAGFYTVSIEWWHFNGLPKEEMIQKYRLID